MNWCRAPSRSIRTALTATSSRAPYSWPNRASTMVAEYQRALVLEPAAAEAYDGLGVTYARIGDYEKSLEFLDKAIRLSPHDPLLYDWYADKADAYFGLKDYDQAIEWDRRAIATNPNKQS